MPTQQTVYIEFLPAKDNIFKKDLKIGDKVNFGGKNCVIHFIRKGILKKDIPETKDFVWYEICCDPNRRMWFHVTNF